MLQPTLLFLLAAIGAPPEFLEDQLLREEPSRLERDCIAGGDAQRGAALFFQPNLLCARCHAPASGKRIGPDLARPDKPQSASNLIESILQPSKAILEGYAADVILTAGGEVITGLPVEDRPDAVVILDGARDWQPAAIPKKSILRRSPSATSLMPAGLVNQLATRQQFLDLARYIIEIAAGGPARELELRPDPGLFTPPPLPGYELDLDHSGLIAALDGGSLKRGEAIYSRTCINCHGTRDAPGSLPTSLAFATGRFKNGCDPYSQYQTITRGFGMMAAQTWMAPRQKYDVIHYIREAFLKGSNPTQYTPADAVYLERLPRGSSRGPEPVDLEPWSLMNYGPTLMGTFEAGKDGSNIAYKGLAVRLDAGPGGIARGRHWMLYELDTLRMAAVWSGTEFIDWNGINFNGRHEIHPRIRGSIQAANPDGPGWANPQTGGFEEARLSGRDGRHFGPLPAAWAHFQGLYHHHQSAILSYRIGAASILEKPSILAENSPPPAEPVFVRVLNIGPRPAALILQAAHVPGGAAEAAGDGVEVRGSGKDAGLVLAAGLLGAPAGCRWDLAPGGDLRLSIPAGGEDVRMALWWTRFAAGSPRGPLLDAVRASGLQLDLRPLLKGSAPRWPDSLQSRGLRGEESGPFAADTLAHPDNNPWLCQMRFSGFDFMPGGGRAAVCTWDGDVWMVSGLDSPDLGLRWKRIASGLFQPLGLKVRNGAIFVGCRNQIAILRDLNGDGETDYYENFNSDHQVTEHFHEFAMDLQTDAQGNFYYAKGARHARTALVPHHGTLLRVAADGSRTDILATGFRAPNGVCVNPDGTFVLTDQEGHWTPKNRINLVKAGGFYGNMWGYHDITDPADAAMEQPLCWITNAFDRSPSEVVRVEGDAWGRLGGGLLNLSYGYGRIHLILEDEAGGRRQAWLCALPLPAFPTGIMRGRFQPDRGELYCCGLFGWAGNQTQPGGFYRVRRTANPVRMPIGMHAVQGGLAIDFTCKIDPVCLADTSGFAVAAWSIRRTASYGSDHIGERKLQVTAARPAGDGSSVFLEIPALAPTPCMEIKYRLRGADGTPFEGTLDGTIHQLAIP